MTERRISVQDSKTGEVMLDGQLIWQPRRLRSPFKKDWYAMGQKAELDLALTGRELGLEALIVLSFLRSQLDFENFINVSQSNAARLLKMPRQNIHRAIKKLIEMNIITPGPKVGKNRTFQMNAHFAWKGSTNTHDSAWKKATHLRIVRRPKKRGLDEDRDPNTIDWLTGKTDVEDTPAPGNVRPTE